MSANDSKVIVHLDALDGWRGISILLVLAAHLLPLGPKELQLNVASGVLGMVIFFILSGFLITSFLLKKTTVPNFLIRRFFRIIPLAWLYLGLALLIAKAPIETWSAHFLFYANLPPMQLVNLTAHMWSLCVEVEFYLGVAMLVALFGARGLLVLPVAGLFFTWLRVSHEVYVSSITYYRIDEILAGCTLALIYHHRHGSVLMQSLKRMPQLPLFILLCLSCLQQSEWLNYFRPYLAAAMVGSTLLNPGKGFAVLLNNRILVYLAATSYALYVIHPLLADSWLGSGNIIEKYAKRPLLFAVLFVLAHLSSYYYEHRWTAFGRKLSNRFN